MHLATDILEKYKVSFVTSQEFAIYNRICSVDATMSQFIGDHYVVNAANRLLKGLTNVLSGKMDIYNPYSKSLFMLVADETVTRFYDYYDKDYEDSSVLPDYILPTADLAIIVEAWRNYLVQSPLKNAGL